MEEIKLEIALIHSEGISDIIINSIKNEIDDKTVNLTIKKRKSEIMVGLEWFMPTALTVYILKPYIEAFLQEMGKDHYQVIKKAILTGARKLVGKDKVVTINVLTSTNAPKKIIGEYSFAFSTLITLSSKYKVKFLFDDCLSIEELEDYANKIASFVMYNSDEEIMKILKKNQNIVILNTSICTYNRNAKEILVLNPIPKKY